MWFWYVDEFKMSYIQPVRGEEDHIKRNELGESGVKWSEAPMFKKWGK